MKEYRLTVRVNADLRRRLAKTAKRKGKREAEVIREALDAHLEPDKEHETAYDALKRLGVIGAVQFDERDLATNPKHLEGFGEA